jgi:[acyl-carrier-protein] S-malonyltransferase
VSKLAFVFPGQGSQSQGMMDAYGTRFPVVKTLFEQASDILGYNLWRVVAHDEGGQLNNTVFTQPALLVASVAMWTVWQEQSERRPDVMAGHSLGEYSALVCSGALAFADAVALVAARGEAMQSAVADGVGAMAAIVGLADEQVEAACKQAGMIGLVAPANYNSIGQVVVSGETAAVEKVIELAKVAGAKIAKRILVSVPSHCELMKPAACNLSEKLNAICFNDPIIPVINNIDVQFSDSAQCTKEALIRQLCGPVRWVESIQKMRGMGVTTIAECGPGKVLTGLIKRIDKSLKLFALTDPDVMSECSASGEM